MASTAVAKAKINLPTDVNAAMAAEIAQLQKRLSAPTGDRIAVTQSKTFKLPGGQEVDEFDGVVVEFIAANYYYEQAYQRGENNPASCFALSFETAGMAPSENAPGAQAGSCASCWANKFGSKGKGKACSNHYLLAVLPTDADASTPLSILKISPTAMQPFDGHVGAIVRKYGLPVRGAITNFSFNRESDYATIRFRDVGQCDKDLLLLAQSRLEEARQRLAIEPNVEAANDDAKPVKGPAKRSTTARR